MTHQLGHQPTSDLTGELIYSVVVAPADRVGRTAGPAQMTAVRYCDICRRWGANGSTHVCWLNWRGRLSDLLMDLS
jgi:hypothetical protein